MTAWRGDHSQFSYGIEAVQSGRPVCKRTETAVKITVTIKSACEMTGLGKTKLYEAIGSGQVATIRIGRRRLVNVESLRQFVGAL